MLWYISEGKAIGSRKGKLLQDKEFTEENWSVLMRLGKG